PYSDGQIVAGAGGLEYIGSVQNYYGNNRYLNGQFLTTAKKEFGDIKTTLMVGTSFDDRNVSLRPTTH
ncbi:MAG: hypothetical protein OEW75_16050, partial [Cyclobacteriaceae bacterium]|nr:hypothetical protein [Cyclobacteriaceae bacterium]